MVWEDFSRDTSQTREIAPPIMMTLRTVVVIIIGEPPYHTIPSYWWATIPYRTITIQCAPRWSASKLMKRQPYAAVALGLGTGGTGHWVTTKDVTLCNTVALRASTKDVTQLISITHYRTCNTEHITRSNAWIYLETSKHSTTDSTQSTLSKSYLKDAGLPSIQCFSNFQFPASKEMNDLQEFDCTERFLAPSSSHLMFIFNCCFDNQGFPLYHQT